jgi:superfamily II DNA or RNA helicase
MVSELPASLGDAVRAMGATFAHSSLALGREYAEQGRVGPIRTGTSPNGTVLHAGVRGSARREYQTVVTLRPTGAVTSFCSCPVRTNCKHGAALLYAAASAAPGPSAPEWRQALAAVSEHDRRARSGATTALALRFERGYADGLYLRPLAMGARGKWIKTGAGWDDLHSRWRSTWIEEQRRPLFALGQLRFSWGGTSYGYGSSGDAIALDRLGPQVWPLLHEAAAAGVVLLAAHNTPTIRLLDADAELLTRITTSDAGLLLTTTVVADGREWTGPDVALVGPDGPHGVVLTDDAGLLLAGFPRPLSDAQADLARAHRRITVPPADLAQFSAGFLPALRRTTRVEVADDVRLPEALPPQLALSVRFARGHVTELRWGLRYRVGDQVFDVAATPAPDDPPVRDREAEARLVASLPAEPWALTHGQAGAPLVSGHRLQGPASARFVEEWLPRLEARPDIVVTTSGERPGYRFSEAAPTVRLAITDPGEAGDWFNLDVAVSLDGEEVTFAALFAALARHESHLILDSGTWFSLERPELAQLRAVIAEASQLEPSGEAQLRLRAEHAGLWEELVSLGIVAEQSAAWQRAVSGLLDATELPQVPVPAHLHATLRPYQLDGYRWLAFLWRSRLGGVLADDMGLGKTVQLLAAILHTRDAEPGGPPVLVVAPTSVLSTWASQAAQFAPSLRVGVVDRTHAKRGEPLAEVCARSDVVVTSYTLLRLGEAEYSRQQWSAVVLDEAQFVKNRHSATYKAVRRLQARVRFAVTGTPLENSLMDLWSMLSIATPGLFPDPEGFTEIYRRPIERGDAPDVLARLRRRVRPVLLRRTKGEVARELPPKMEQVLTIPLAPAHRRLYDRHLAAVRKQVLGLVGDLDHNRIQVLAALTHLRQLSLSPALVDAEAPAVSAKIDALVELVHDMAEEGHRALVFSQFTGFLGLVRTRLDAERIGYSYLDGRTRNREARIAAFRDGDDPVFLISLKAGGFGLTLTEADYVFILDPWWNPAVENQAIDRTHRIGQENPVNVYRLVSEDTVEEKVVALQERKRDLFDSVVGDGSGFGAALTADDIRGLLEPG